MGRGVGPDDNEMNSRIGAVSAAYLRVIPTTKFSPRALRFCTALALGCLVTPAYALVLGTLPPTDAGFSVAERFVAIPIWINHQLPHSEPWSEHLTRWRREGYAIFDLLLIGLGAALAWVAMPSRLGLLPGATALLAPAMAVAVFGWLSTPQRPVWGLIVASAVAFGLSIAWASFTSKRPSHRTSLSLLGVCVVGCLAFLFHQTYHYLFIVSGVVTFAMSGLLLLAWWNRLRI